MRCPTGATTPSEQERVLQKFSIGEGEICYSWPPVWFNHASAIMISLTSVFLIALQVHSFPTPIISLADSIAFSDARDESEAKHRTLCVRDFILPFTSSIYSQVHRYHAPSASSPPFSDLGRYVFIFHLTYREHPELTCIT